MKELISIVLTLYNKASYIEDTIFSIYKQSYSNWELIIVDDCSTDGSFEIAKLFCEKLGISNKCKFLQNEKNLRVAKTFERGLKEAKGEWISMCDGDDMFLRDKLEKQLRYCNENKMEFCAGNFIQIDQNNNFLLLGKSLLLKKIQRHYMKNRCYKNTLILPDCVGSAIFFSKHIKDLLIKYPFPERVAQDFRVETFTSLSDIKIGFINDNLYLYRKCDGCISNCNSIVSCYEEFFRTRLDTYKYIINNLNIKSDEKVWLGKWNSICSQFYSFTKSNQIFSFSLFLKLILTNIGIKHKLIVIYQYFNTVIHKILK